jgi:hypothetical protein
MSMLHHSSSSKTLFLPFDMPQLRSTPRRKTAIAHLTHVENERRRENEMQVK